MLDGIKFTFKVPSLEMWQDRAGIELNSNVNLLTGELKQSTRYRREYNDGTKTFKKWGTLNSYYVEAIEKIVGEKSTYRINARGSLHKAYHGTNFNRYYWHELQDHLVYLTDTFGVTPNNMIIQNLEFGVNIELDQPVITLLDTSLISFSGKTFNQYDKDRYGHSIGYYYKFWEYDLKLYDKSLQNDLKDRHIFRIEKAVSKMRAISKHDIKLVSDLSIREKVLSLSESLLASWDRVILIDQSITARVNDSLIQSNLKDYSNPKYWEKINSSADKKRYHLDKLKSIQNKFGDHLHDNLKRQMQDEWKAGFIETSYPVFSPFVRDTKNTPLPRVFPIKIKGEKAHHEVKEDIPKKRVRKKIGLKEACVKNGRYVNFFSEQMQMRAV